MPTSNKTTNLNLNNWLSTDKPKREDFTGDNLIIDNIVGTHIADTIMHFTTADRARLNAPFYIDTIGGTGEASDTFLLDIEPTLLFIFLKNQPFITYDTTNSCTVCNCGIAIPEYGNSMGISLNGSTLTLQQSQSYPSSGGTYINLNKGAGQYVFIALK